MTCPAVYTIYKGKDTVMSLRVSVDGIYQDLNGKRCVLLIDKKSHTEWDDESLVMVVKVLKPDTETEWLHFALTDTETDALDVGSSYQWRVKIEDGAVAPIWTPLQPLLVVQ